jgi:endoglucanase
MPFKRGFFSRSLFLEVGRKHANAGTGTWAATAGVLVGCGLALSACSSDPPIWPGPVGSGSGGSSAGSGGTSAATGGSTGSGGVAATGGDDAGGGPSVEGLLIDDFEDHDDQPIVGSAWYHYDDQPEGGLSTQSVKFDEPGAPSPQASPLGSLLFSFSFDQGDLGYEPFVGVGVDLRSGGQALDLSNYSALRYSYRGAAHVLRLETSDVDDYDYHGMKVPASSSWKTVELPLALFSQEGWGNNVTLDPAHAVGISFHLRGATGQADTLAIDDLYVGQSNDQLVLTVHEPAPPSKTPLPSLTIDNPLQQLAMDHLSRGANLDSWLEADRFTEFTYDKSYVEKLAAAGFTSLRLPIDLDLYAENVTTAGDAISFDLHDDLFLVLDSFEEWTADSGMSLTIDYHQYDRSLDFADVPSQDLAVALWGKVAEHFADNTREDLFFELLNEPELSVSGDAPTSAEWTALAERMIAAIRTHDTSRTLLFGDVEWYGIGALTKRQPLSDDNVIYVFHFYEPFLFTHQGTGWTDLLSVHDIPYPYTAERWSEDGHDLGLSSLLPGWVLDQVDDYYRVGHASWIYNRVAEAKQWGVDHDLPVM